MIPAPGIKIWLVELMTVDSFEINNWQILICTMASAWNTQFTEVELEAALSNSLQHFLHISDLKHEQKLCLETVAQKHDVFRILTTGFERSLIFQLLPCLLKDLWKLERACAFGFYNERPGWRVDMSWLEGICLRGLKRKANIQSHFHLYCISLKGFHQSVIELL